MPLRMPYDFMSFEYTVICPLDGSAVACAGPMAVWP
jgi:hypothetical protein